MLDKKLNITRIIDCTILYSDIEKPLGVYDIMKGDKKSDVFFFYKNYYVDKEQIDEQWLRNIWLAKEEMMRSFYENKQAFIDSHPAYNSIKLNWIKIILINLFFTILCTSFILFFRYCLLDGYL